MYIFAQILLNQLKKYFIIISIGGVAPVVLGACAAGADPTDVRLL